MTPKSVVGANDPWVFFFPHYFSQYAIYLAFFIEGMSENNVPYFIATK
jgi:hypothetical protein